MNFDVKAVCKILNGIVVKKQRTNRQHTILHFPLVKNPELQSENQLALQIQVGILIGIGEF